MSPLTGESSDSAVLAALVLVPAIVGVVLLATGRRSDRLAAPLSLVAVAGSVVLAAVAASTRPTLSVPFLGVVEGGDLRLAVDGLSAVLVVTVTVVALLVAAFAAFDVPAHEARARFFGYLLVFVAAMLTTVSATTVPALLFSWEVMGATSYALVGYRWDRPGKLAAGTRAFVTTRAGDVGLYVAAGAALAGTGGLRLADLATAAGGWRDVAAAGLLIAALGKSAQLPFSGWLSAAMEGPSPVSALLHSATMVAAGGYLLLRVQPLLAATGWAATAAAWAGGLTALVLGAVACAQRDLKQLLAASTASQIGFVVLGAGAGVTAAGAGQLVAHAAVKAGLFVAAGAWLTALGTKQLAGLRGAARRYPGIGSAATVAALALAGAPPLALWVTKEGVLGGVENPALWVVGLAAAVLSAVYAGRIMAVVLARPAGDELLDVEEPGTRRVPSGVVVVASVFALFSVALGALVVPAVARAFARVTGAGVEGAAAVGALALAGVLAVLALGVTVAIERQRPALMAALERSPLGSWAGLRALLSPRPAMALARALARLDDQGIDRAVWGVAGGVRRLAGLTSRADVRFVDGAVVGLASALRRAGAAARRPQTGLLHQYYAQAVTGLGVLLVLLLVVR